MNKILLPLVISVLTFAATAHGSDQTTLLRCGVKSGDKYPSYNPTSELKNSGDTRLNRIAGAAQVETLRLTSFDGGTGSTDIDESVQANTIDTRLPRRFTFATCGCFWR